jgi:O-acetyl-ADP-ribose deacetylase (regulator of RNase III)
VTGRIRNVEESMLDNRLYVETGDITEMEVDAVVNAANSGLMGGGGVDGAIHRRGGPAILSACKKIREHQYPDGLPAGKAVITPAGNLPCKHVIHTVGPVWKGGSANERQVLADAYRNSLVLAGDTGLKTVAFPAISTGIYGFPKDLAAKISFNTIKQYLAERGLPQTVYLVFFSEGDSRLFLEAISDLK